MLHFPQRKHSAPHLYAEQTDAPLPETLNPKLRYAYFSTIATGRRSTPIRPIGGWRQPSIIWRRKRAAAMAATTIR